jgi:dTDP-4-dehydrorhamnose reductase
MSTDIKYPYKKPEIWGGIECTINRVNDKYRDQLALCGHYSREDDILKISQLGIRKIRYPVLWEYHCAGNETHWDWTATQLEKLKALHLEPIVTLLHHGSGPKHTDLLDKKFPLQFAAYAKEVAEKFPGLRYFTPVNEPLTTARFSGLYGFWYPHHRNEKSFAEILLNEVEGIVRAMQEIRKIIPHAELIQTEDLAKTHSTSALDYQAAFENRRRWLTYDLLCGKVNSKHFFWKYFIALGIKPSRLSFFVDNPTPPSVMGFNYYITSERYLDQDIANYPAFTHGGNGRHIYADTEAVRTGHNEGIPGLLTEAWNRYRIPLAVTECYLHCTREEQVRWLKEVWDECCGLNNKGIPIVALTAWSLIGAFDWNSLLTREANDYEPGAFIISNGELRPTLLSQAIRGLAVNGEYKHPLLANKGWWHRLSKKSEQQTNTHTVNSSPLLIFGRNGMLGAEMMKTCGARGIEYIAFSKEDLDILDAEEIKNAIEKFKPWAIINATGFVNVDEAELHPSECFAINALAPEMLGQICQAYGLPLMGFSTDLVFDGSKSSPYYEEDPVLPINTYGASKAAGEKLMIAANSSALVIRSSVFFGTTDKFSFVDAVKEAMEQGSTFYTPHDVLVSPTYLPDLCNAALDLFIDGLSGIWHLTNEGSTTWADFAYDIATRLRLGTNNLVSKPVDEMGWKARRPRNSVLQSEKGVFLPPLENALDRYLELK